MTANRRRALVFAVAVGLGVIALAARNAPVAAQEAPFRNPNLPTERRAADLLSRLSLGEKVSLLIERAAPVERLGIPAFPWWNEALHGVARAGRATVFPQAIGLAATWDTDLMLRVATAISDEARAKHHDALRREKRNLYQGLTFWSPNINIFRDPRWGRGQETYGEDPFLTSAMGTAFVKGLQGNDPRYLKTVATPKHYAVHSGPEPLRHTFDAVVSEADLRQTYLAAFRATVIDAKAESIMCAYQRFRGKPCCGSDELLSKILREEWGFKGYVVSDCGAVQDIFESHKVRKTAAEAAAMAIRAGCDLECGSGSWVPGSPDAFLSLGDAVAAKLVTESDLDTALRRLFTAQLRLGVYDPEERVPFAKIPIEAVDSEPHRTLAREAAAKSIVLLKNEKETLPLSKQLRTLAVIGPNADDVEALLGTYCGTPNEPVSLLSGISSKAPFVKVLHARGSPLADGVPDLQTIPNTSFVTIHQGRRANGLRGEYYSGYFDGAPVFSRVDERLDFDWKDGAPKPELNDDSFSVRWTGELFAPVTGTYTIGAVGLTGFRVWIDGRPLVQGHYEHEPVLATGQLVLRKGRAYPVRVEYYHRKYDASFRLLWQVPGVSDEGDALEAARKADAVVLVLGLSSRLEGEEMPIRVEGFAGGDRTSLDLPKAQQALMEKVVAAAAGKPVVLVLMSGSALAVNWADKNVPAILQVWYPGQAGGEAVAEVLFGSVSPGGRLPVTFYRSVDQLPPFEDYAMKGRTYRYFSGEPLYPFGHGLSYSRFTYSKLRVVPQARVGVPVEVSVEVANVGTALADEVVQVYVKDFEASASVPLRALKSFTRISLKPGERRLVRLTLGERDFALVGGDGRWVIEPGKFEISVGGKQPGLTGTADSVTTQVVSATIELTGDAKQLAP
jgi:beta-glucosidase